MKYLRARKRMKPKDIEDQVETMAEEIMMASNKFLMQKRKIKESKEIESKLI